MADGPIDRDAILGMHSDRLAETNRVLQQAALTLANAYRSIADTRRLITKRKGHDMPATVLDPVITQRKTFVLQMRDRLARCRRLREIQRAHKAALLKSIIRIGLQDGRLPTESSGVYVGRPGTGSQCAACGSVS